MLEKSPEFSRKIWWTQVDVVRVLFYQPHFENEQIEPQLAILAC